MALAPLGISQSPSHSVEFPYHLSRGTPCEKEARPGAGLREQKLEATQPAPGPQLTATFWAPGQSSIQPELCHSQLCRGQVPPQGLSQSSAVSVNTYRCPTFASASHLEPDREAKLPLICHSDICLEGTPPFARAGGLHCAHLSLSLSLCCSISGNAHSFPTPVPSASSQGGSTM